MFDKLKELMGIKVIVSDKCPDGTAYMAVVEIDPATGKPVIKSAPSVINIGSK